MIEDLFPISIDIETANLGPGKPGDMVNPKDWTIACVAAYDPLFDIKFVFVPFEKLIQMEQDYDVNAHTLGHLKHTLNKATKADYVLPLNPLTNDVGSFIDCFQYWVATRRYFIAHRGHKFDWPILGHHLGIKSGINLLNLRGAMIDTHAYIEASTGYNCGLQALMTAALGSTKGKILKGKDAPKLWTDGIEHYQENLSIDNFTLVMDYCLDDAIKTYQIYEQGLTQGQFTVRPYGYDKSVIIDIDAWGMNL